jgi:hypothetical protein
MNTKRGLIQFSNFLKIRMNLISGREIVSDFISKSRKRRGNQGELRPIMSWTEISKSNSPEMRGIGGGAGMQLGSEKSTIKIAKALSPKDCIIPRRDTGF